jgi:hypothetical protein
MLSSACTGGETHTYRLYFLAGQSNMVGYGHVAELPEELRDTVDRVMIFHGRTVFDGKGRGGFGVWAPLKPGFGFGFRTDDHHIELSERFGPELSFGHTVAKRLPESSIALVKYATGGTGLASGAGLSNWHPTIRYRRSSNQFDYALETLHNALADRDIDGDGVRDKLVPAGVIWMQGESDANQSPTAARTYQANLTQFVRSFRSAMQNDRLPFVIGKITDSGKADDGSVMDYIEDVQAAQIAVTAADDCAELVTVTEELNYADDEYHYDTNGNIRLGEAFADAVLRLEARCPQGLFTE